MSADHLPPGSGAATEAYAEIWDSWKLYGPLIGTIRNYGISVIPDDWVPWLIWDLGLEDVVPYVRDMRQALAEGPAWQRARGTARGIEIGIGWVESAGIVAPPDQRHDWWQFQVGFEVPVSDVQQLQQLVGIINLSKAAEDELFRIFSPGADFRPIRMDWHRMDRGKADGYSGERIWEGGPLVSMGWTGAAVTELQSEVLAGFEITEVTLARWFAGCRFDVSRMDSRRQPMSQVAITLGAAVSDYAFAHDTWPVVWPESWDEASEPSVTSTSWGEA